MSLINDFININNGLIFNKDSEIGQIQLLTLCAISAVSHIDLVPNQCHVFDLTYKYKIQYY
jgi:hypothetical protein